MLLHFSRQVIRCPQALAVFTILSGLFANACADAAADLISDYSQDLSLTVPSTQIAKDYAPFYFGNLSLSASYSKNNNAQNSAGSGASGFNLLLQNSSNSALYVYLASVIEGPGLPGVTYCALPANSLVNYQNCAGVTVPTSANIYLYLSTSNVSYSAPNYFSNCSSSLTRVGSAGSHNNGYMINNDGATHELTISNADTCTLY